MKNNLYSVFTLLTLVGAVFATGGIQAHALDATLRTSQNASSDDKGTAFNESVRLESSLKTSAGNTYGRESHDADKASSSKRETEHNQGTTTKSGRDYNFDRRDPAAWFQANLHSVTNTSAEWFAPFWRFFDRIGLSTTSTTTATSTMTLSKIKITDITDTSANVEWSLNKFADVTVYYSISTPVVIAKTTSQVKVSAFRFSHELTLESLAPNTTYYYLVVADNRFGTTTVSGEGSFTTSSR